MSILGSNLAAGVAGTVSQAQQVIRQRQQQEGNPQSELRRVRELFETHLKALEDADQFESPAHLHIEGEVPDHESGQQQGRRRSPQHSLPEQLQTAAEQAPAPPPAPKPDPRQGELYRHLDIQA